jgi:hypothetical protein
MDPRQFDTLAKSVAQLRTRRGLLRAVGLALGAGAVGAMAPNDSDAADSCRPRGAVCTGDQMCCSGTCDPPDATGRRRCGCHEPNVNSTYRRACRNITMTCTAEGNILRAFCQDSFGDWWNASINVDSCAAQNYVITNCNARLTCGGC